MAWRIRRTMKLGPLRLSFGKKGVGASVGVLGQRIAMRADGNVVVSNSVPGTGISHQETIQQPATTALVAAENFQKKPEPKGSGCAIALLFMAGVGIVSGGREANDGGCMSGVGVVVIAIGILIAVFDSRRAKKWQAERDAIKGAVAQEMHEAQRTQEELVAQYRAQLIATYGPEIADGILEHRYWQGATEEMIQLSLGEPAEKSVTVLKTKRKEVWKYHQIAGNQYALRILFEDGVCVGWETR